jgi:hypothetical protein
LFAHWFGFDFVAYGTPQSSQSRCADAPSQSSQIVEIVSSGEKVIGSVSCGLRLLVHAQGLVVPFVFPQCEHQHGKFAGDGNDGFSFVPAPTARGEHQAVSFQIRIRPERPKDVLGGTDEQPPQIGITGFRYSQLFV